MAKYYSISEVSEVVDISNRMLRHYDNIGLVKSTRINGTRNYSDADILFAKDVKSLREIGCSLSEIGILFQKKMNNGTDFKFSKEKSKEELILDIGAKLDNLKELLIRNF